MGRGTASARIPAVAVRRERLRGELAFVPFVEGLGAWLADAGWAEGLRLDDAPGQPTIAEFHLNGAHWMLLRLRWDWVERRVYTELLRMARIDTSPQTPVGGHAQPFDDFDLESALETVRWMVTRWT